MPGEAVPTIYAETNWIVSLFYPHRTNHLGTKKLFEEAEQRRVNLRIPYGCLLEAVHAIESAGQEAMQAIAKATEYITNAQRHGEVSLDSVVGPLLSSTTFLAKNPRPFLDALRHNPGIHWLTSTVDEIQYLDVVRNQVRFRGKDKFDLYVIATMLADRARGGPEPALFFSENKAEFEPRSAGPTYTTSPRPAAVSMPALPRMPDELYRSARVTWRSDYDVQQGLVMWNGTFSGASGPPILP